MSKIDRDFDNKEYDSNDSKWLEDWMRAESDDIEIPESLEPENIAKKLQGVKQNKGHSFTNWKKSAFAAAACIAVIGLSVKALQLGTKGDKCSDSACNDKVQMEMAQDETEDIADVDENASEEMGALEEDSAQISGASDKQNTMVEKESALDKEDVANNEMGLDRVEEVAIISGEGTTFQEGNGGSVLVEDGCIYTGDDKELVISTYENGNVTEISRISMNQKVKEFQYTGGTLACMTADAESTTISVYETENPEELKSISTFSVEGDYQCSYLQGEILYVFTQAGKVQRVDLESCETNTHSLDGTIDEYFADGEWIYGFTGVDGGTKIQQYQFTEGELKKSKETTVEFAMDSVLDIRKKDSNLEFLIKKENAIALLSYDEELRKILEKTNHTEVQDCAGVFTSKGILTIGVKMQEAVISMMDDDSLQTKGSKLLKGVQKLEIGRLWISDDNSWIGLSVYHDDKEAGSYQVYQYDGESEFTEVKSTSIEQGTPLEEVVSNDSVMNENVGKLDVLVE